MAGLVAAFVFATQMLNFPVGAGTSGHLLGGALAAVLVGPWTGVLVHERRAARAGLLFADGGITALGTNIMLMGSSPSPSAGWCSGLCRRAAQAARAGGRPRRSRALVSVPVAALAFVGLYAVGGTAPVALGALVTAMLGWHTLIGIGEARHHRLAVGSVVAVRPDLVLRRPPGAGRATLEIRAPPSAGAAA